MMSITCVTSEGSIDAWGLGCPLRPHWCLSTMLSLGPYTSNWPVMPPRAIVMSEPELWMKVIPGSVVLLQLESMLMSKASVTTGDHERAGPGSLDTRELVLPLAGSITGKSCLPTPRRTGPSGMDVG